MSALHIFAMHFQRLTPQESSLSNQHTSDRINKQSAFMCKYDQSKNFTDYKSPQHRRHLKQIT